MTTKAEILTTEKGCFNCNKFKNCSFIRTEKDRGRDFKEVMMYEDGFTEIRFGCNCGSYKPRPVPEKVLFT
jgi:hypothetical protein